jgi:hypothetical protein
MRRWGKNEDGGRDEDGRWGEEVGKKRGRGRYERDGASPVPTRYEA